MKKKKEQENESLLSDVEKGIVSDFLLIWQIGLGVVSLVKLLSGLFHQRSLP